MHTGPLSTSSTQTLPVGYFKVRASKHETEASVHSNPRAGIPVLPPTPDATSRSTRIESTTDHDHDATSAAPHSGEAEDEYTLCAFGDISLSEVVVPPLHAPAHSSLLQPRYPQPRLRPKVRRPPMPKRRPSYIRVPDPSPYTGGMDPNEHRPGSPRPFANNLSWTPHQPLLLSRLPATEREQGIEPAKNGDLSIGRLFDELIPPSPSIRLSPPGLPANQAPSLPQETCSVPHGSPSSPTPPARQDKPKEAPWRQRLPPRSPIPKWDI